MKRLRILTWHVHGNYLYYLSQVPHELNVLYAPGGPPGYAGARGKLPWGANVREVHVDEVRGQRFDCVLFQARRHYVEDQYQLLSPTQRALPRIFLEHDPPQEHPTNTLHAVQDRNALLVHVTAFNALMWDSGITPARVIEHGVVVPPDVRYTGELARGLAVVNQLAKRGRRLGADVYARAAAAVPIDLVGMESQAAGGLGEIPNPELAAFMARYRFFFNPIRYTSLGLAVCEAMTLGLPIVGLATAELATVVRNGVEGFVATAPDALVEPMRALLADRDYAARLGAAARARALERFGIARFVADWTRAFRDACG
ncbi:MAG: glycosyltransferase [Gammaproteobacteria bacterium]|nr:glycosyltransferase [Gammaproteobacteria bacterium]